jgi:predicted GNAT family acetyltransferase
MADEEFGVQDARDRDRYEIRLGGELAGFAQYVRRGGRTFFVHTEIDPRFEGKGLGSKLAAGALAAERDAGTKIVPLCPFIRSYIDRHPDEMGNVDHELLDHIDAG